jgi:hypothetical protein
VESSFEPSLAFQGGLGGADVVDLITQQPGTIVRHKFVECYTPASTGWGYFHLQTWAGNTCWPFPFAGGRRLKRSSAYNSPGMLAFANVAAEHARPVLSSAPDPGRLVRTIRRLIGTLAAPTMPRVMRQHSKMSHATDRRS